MPRLALNRIALTSLLMFVLVACYPMAPMPPAATATLEPSPQLAATQLAELMRRGEPDDPIVCAIDDAADFKAVPGARSDAKWAVISEYAFAPEWSVGQHTYTLWFEPCPYSREMPDHVTRSFRVTESTPLHTSPVYFGPLGVTVTQDPYGSTLESIHPLQTAVARISDIQLAQAEAQTVARECAIWISWDDSNVRHALLPHKPCQY